MLELRVDLLCEEAPEMASIWRLVCWCMDREYVLRSVGGGGDVGM